ncbi:MFS transporter [Geoglobus acetivorans]|uniref:MFS transporter n=1 Tax=Geoglobus acetivorans TaxID=565033 RepID=A0ABZ3H2M7_GEOAI|nr:MFS transporter [Geoglobus acetivorans]
MVSVRKTLLLTGLVLITFASQAIWVTFSPVTTLVAQNLGVPAEYVGYLAVTYPLFFLILTVPSGILLDRNFRLWLLFGTVMTFIGGAGRLLDHTNYFWLLLCQLFSATGQPFLLNAFVPFASRMYAERRSVVISVLSLSMYLGTVFSLLVGYEFYADGGLFALIMPPALLSAIGFAFFVSGYRVLDSVPVDRRAFRFSDVVGRKDLWIIGIILGLGVAAFDNLATWLQPALESVKLGEIAGDAVAVSIVLGLVGVAAIPGFISAKNARTRYMRGVVPLIAGFFVILAILPSKLLVFVFLGLAGLLMLPAYPLIMDWIGYFHEKRIQGSATGFVGLVSRAISVMLMFIAPYFIYSARAYFTFLASVVTIAFFFTMILPDDRKMKKDHS